MTYELALELKNAGFPVKKYEDSIYCNLSSDESNPFTFETQDGLYIYPTLSELIEACHSQWSKFKLEQDYEMDGISVTTTHIWQAGIHTNKEGYFLGQGSTPEEAVAKLWLELNKK